MKRTSGVILLVCAVIGAAAGVALDVVLTGASRATFSPSYALPILLVLLGLFCLAFAWQIRRAVRDPKAPRPDPFRAVRILVLSKASSMLGAASGAFGLGLIGYLLTRPVAPRIGSMTAEIVTAIGGAALVILALIAERLCTLPKDPDEREHGTAAPGAEPEY